MKKATYTLTIEFDNGDKLRRGGLTQTRCYEILKRYRDFGWMTASGEVMKSWMISTGEQSCGASL